MKNQKGFVSIIVASILMVLLSLITIGFSRYMQREQRQAIDRHLSSQAYYAAESGVNDVYKEIELNGDVAAKPDCDMAGRANGGVLEPGEDGVAITCLIINPIPEELEFRNESITTQQSTVFPLKTSSGVNIDSTYIYWDKDGPPQPSLNSCSRNPLLLPTNQAANRTPILRFDITPSSSDRDALFNNTKTVFLYPCTGGGAAGLTDIDFGSLGRGDIIPVRCPAGRCDFELTNMGGNNFVVRVKSIYSNANLVISADLVGGGAAGLVGAQTVVDSTGKAGDVLRRIKVNISNVNDFPFPEFAIQSFDGVCKLIGVAPAVAPTVGDVVAYPCPN